MAPTTEIGTTMDRQLTPEDVKTFQRRGGHPLTCRQCRGAGQCDRTDVGLAAGDHHVLQGHVNEDGTLVLRCPCCAYQQELWGQLETIIRQVAD